MPTPLISTFVRGLLAEGLIGLTACSVQVDSSSLLSEDVSDFCSSPCAKSLVPLISCLLLQHFAKWFLLPHRVHCLLKAGHFLGSPLMWPMFSAIKTRFFSTSVRYDFIDFLFDSNFCWSLVLYFCGVLIRAFQTSGVFKSFG